MRLSPSANCYCNFIMKYLCIHSALIQKTKDIQYIKIRYAHPSAETGTVS